MRRIRKPFLAAAAIFLFVSAGQAAYIKYSLDVNISPVSYTASGYAIITYVPDQDTNEIPFLFEGDIDKNIGLCRVNETAARIEKSGPASGRIIPAGTLPAYSTSTIKIEFTFTESPYLGSIHRYSGPWYPLIQDPSGDRRQDYRVALSCPVKYKSLTTGKTAREDILNGKRYSISFSSRVPSFGIIVSSAVSIFSSDNGRVRIFYACSRGYEKYRKHVFRDAETAISFYEDLFGFYPQPLVCIYQTGIKTGGGFPAAPGILGIHDFSFTDKKYLERQNHYT